MSPPSSQNQMWWTSHQSNGVVQPSMAPEDAGAHLGVERAVQLIVAGLVDPLADAHRPSPAQIEITAQLAFQAPLHEAECSAS